MPLLVRPPKIREGKHEDEQHWKHEQDCGSGEKLLAMLCGIYSSTRRRAVGSAYCDPLCGSVDGLASFDVSMG